jgi:hypothetical protein
MAIFYVIWILGCLLANPADDPEAMLARMSEPPAKIADVLGEDGVASISQARRVSILPVNARDSHGGELAVFVPAGRIRNLGPRVVLQLKKALLERTSYRAMALVKLCGEFSPSLQIDLCAIIARHFNCW